MKTQLSIFGAENLASTVQTPAAPKLVPHNGWPFPGMTPESSAQASMALSPEYQEMLASVIKANGGARLTAQEVLASVPKDWRDLCGKYAHGNISNWCAKAHGIEVAYVYHDGGWFHFEFMAKGAPQ
jgi:hypothetical protein